MSDSKLPSVHQYLFDVSLGKDNHMSEFQNRGKMNKIHALSTKTLLVNV